MAALSDYQKKYDYMKDISEYLVYAIIDKFSNNVMYIGKTNNVRNRVDVLLKNSGNCSKKVSAWLKKYVSLNGEPDVVILEDGLNKNKALEREKYWINKYDDGTLLNTHLYRKKQWQHLTVYQR